MFLAAMFASTAHAEDRAVVRLVVGADTTEVEAGLSATDIATRVRVQAAAGFVPVDLSPASDGTWTVVFQESSAEVDVQVELTERDFGSAVSDAATDGRGILDLEVTAAGGSTVYSVIFGETGDQEVVAVSNLEAIEAQIDAWAEDGFVPVAVEGVVDSSGASSFVMVGEDSEATVRFVSGSSWVDFAVDWADAYDNGYRVQDFDLDPGGDGGSFLGIMNWDEGSTREIILTGPASKLSDLIEAADPLGEAPQAVEVDYDLNVNSPPPAFIAKLAQNIPLSAAGATGYSYAIGHGSAMVAAEGYGKAKVAADGDVDMTPSHRFHIASVSKALTATLILEWADDNSWDYKTKTVEDFWLPIWPVGAYGDQITLEDLLQHESGLPKLKVCDDPSYAVAMLGLITSDAVEPWGYANSNYCLLRYAYDADGGDYEADMYSQVWDPAGLAPPSPEPSTVTWPTMTPESYDVLNYAWGQPAAGSTAWPDFADHGSSYGWQATPTHLVKFLQALRNGAIVSDDIVTSMVQDNVGWKSATVCGAGATGRDGGWRDTGQRGVHSAMRWYNGGWQASLMVNSYIDGFSPMEVLDSAYRAMVGCPVGS